MSTVPPAPPVPPPMPLDLDSAAPTSPKTCASPTFTYSNVCEWAEHPEFWEACAKYNICLHNFPFKFRYKHYESILQLGPTCGLVALSMLINGEVSPDEILNISKMEGYSSNGEMFSCKNMLKLIEKVLSLAEIENINYSLQIGGLFSQETIEKLLKGAALLVPYDADCNHTPCLRKGHTAHWALICGVVITEDPGISYISDPNKVHVFCRHGKSRFVAVWRLDELDKSNKNLWEFSPKKEGDGLMYVLPEGGVGGENGLRDQFLLIEGL